MDHFLNPILTPRPFAFRSRNALARIGEAHGYAPGKAVYFPPKENNYPSPSAPLSSTLPVEEEGKTSRQRQKRKAKPPSTLPEKKGKKNDGRGARPKGTKKGKSGIARSGGKGKGRSSPHVSRLFSHGEGEKNRKKKKEAKVAKNSPLFLL